MRQWPVIFASWFQAAVLWTGLISGVYALEKPVPVPVPEPEPTADHSKFDVLKGPFMTGPDVTRTCLSCHTEAAKQIMKTTHWTWEMVNPQGQRLGKRHVVNNFCTAVSSNEARCSACHIGYGMKDRNFDFTIETNVDCLVCHDTTGKYKKFVAGAGHPVYKEVEFPPGSGKILKPVDLAAVAQEVGKTSRRSCGNCHFSGGGGDSVKHGDLDPSLTKPDRDLDVHMDAKGLNFTCATCHEPVNHNIPGSRYTVQAKDLGPVKIPGRKQANRTSCESCHGIAPHGAKLFGYIPIDVQLNGHVHKVACETCHIPTVARLEPTKIWWDWSTAGKKSPDGKHFKKKDEEGNEIYDTKKGDFKWTMDLVPEYIWFNGVIDYTTLQTKLDDSKTVLINAPRGEYRDPGSRIWPMKRFQGKQPYDKVNKTLVVPHVAGDDDAAYWKNLDWDKAIRAGMQSVGAPYSGQYGFLRTDMFWPQTHMVAPAKDALVCESCHSREGRLASLSGFYIPGRDHSRVLDTLGVLLLVGSLVGVGAHATMFRKSRR